VVASFPVESEANGAVVVDATSLFLSDTYGIAESVRRIQQGNARVDANRSWIDPERTKGFPLNTEIHAVLTFAVDNPGPVLRRAAPDAASPTFEVHHSLVALPEASGWRPRQSDARAGFFGPRFFDFGQSFEGTYNDGYINRWRLVPRDRRPINAASWRVELCHERDLRATRERHDGARQLLLEARVRDVLAEVRGGDVRHAPNAQAESHTRMRAQTAAGATSTPRGSSCAVQTTRSLHTVS
jgi:hypothetical protein